MTTGERIKKIRQGKKISQKELGKKLGVSQQMIGQWETAKANPQIDTLEKIANALDVPLYELLGFDGSIRVDVNSQRPFDIAIHKFQMNERLTDEEEQIITEYIESGQLIKESKAIKQLAKKAYNFISYAHPHSYASSEDDFNKVQDAKQIELEKNRAKPYPLYGVTDSSKPFTRPLQSSYDAPNESHSDSSLKLHTNTRGIDWEQIDDFHFDELMHKLANGENLTQEEINFKSAYLERTLRKIGDIFAKFYSMLNAEGQKKADEQIDRALEQVELLTKIPEYQKKPDQPQK